MTLTEAAERLGVKRQRVHQLLDDGVLTGPQLEGGGRAPANAPRVWVSSLELEESRRRQRRGRKAPGTSAARTEPSGNEADAAYVLKVSLDLARDALRAERIQTARITRLLKEAVTSLEEQQRLAERADRLTEGYSDALTSLLAPGDPSEV